MIEWSPEDREKLQVYLASTKNKLIDYLRSTLPAVNAQTIEATALQAKERNGAEMTVDKILTLGVRLPRRVESENESIDVTAGIPK